MVSQQTHTHEWYIYLSFYLKKGYFIGAYYFSCPPLLKTTLQGCLKVESLWVQRWLILGMHTSLSTVPFTSQCQVGADMTYVRESGLPLFLLVLLVSCNGILFWSTGRHTPPLNGMSSLRHSLVWILFTLWYHNLSPVENADSHAKCECRLRAHIWQMFTQIFTLRVKQLII